jgi:hypothetical protein
MGRRSARPQHIHGNQYNAGRNINIFDQRGQTNYHAEHDINFGTVQNSAQLISALEKLRKQIIQAKIDGHLDQKKAIEVEDHLTKAAQEAEETKPDKNAIISHLTTAKSVLANITAMSGCIPTFVAAIEAVKKLFS